MKTLILLFHPHFDGSRSNKALVDAVRDLPGVTVRDEYRLYPTWQPDVAREQEALENADRILLQFPVEWYSVPSLLKRWEDMVLQHGWAYGSQGHALDGKDVSWACTFGAAAENYVHDPVHHRFTADELMRPLESTFAHCRMSLGRPFYVYSASNPGAEDLTRRVQEYRDYVRRPPVAFGAGPGHSGHGEQAGTE